MSMRRLADLAGESGAGIGRLTAIAKRAERGVNSLQTQAGKEPLAAGALLGP